MALPSSSSPAGETSYAAMDPPGKDLESIGAHCQFPYCNQLDFLPFKCLSCKSTYCLDHRSETAHKCPHAGEWARNQAGRNNTSATSTTSGKSLKPDIYTGQQCSDPKCKTLIHTLTSTGVHCQTCNRDYCLKHRFKEEHNCKNLTPLGARPSVTGQASAQTQAKFAFEKLRLWSKEKTSSLSPSSKPSSRSSTTKTSSSAATDLATLKRTAKGDSKLPPDRRIYLHVEAESSPYPSPSPSPAPPNSSSSSSSIQQHPKSQPLYFDKLWTIGRLLDDAARRLQVKNENNKTQGEQGRLRVFFVEGGRVLAFGEKVGECGLRSGNTVVLLRGVGDGMG